MAIKNNIDLAKDILSDGAKKANSFANSTLEIVYDTVGLRNELSVLFKK